MEDSVSFKRVIDNFFFTGDDGSEEDEGEFGGFPFGGMGGHPGMGGHKKEVDNSRLYELLGVAKTATDSEIKKMYRERAKTEHPDKGGDEEKW